MTRAWLIGGVLAAVAVIGVVVAVVISGGDSASSSATTAAPGELSGDQQAQLEEFRSCLSDQGVELPEPGGAPPASQQPDAEMLRALQQCQQYAPEGFGPGGPPIQGQ